MESTPRCYLINYFVCWLVGWLAYLCYARFLKWGEKNCSRTRL